jgi:hypothetical protein
VKKPLMLILFMIKAKSLFHPYIICEM